ncbi:SGNH/GDSL hydrolase family protein [Saccharothrix longispora]|uniref:SGNH/GDSL hydrolase family protein n=1 Tax=Saccharothrix longispora TaxID=33920 RepID=UPI0028FD52FF|nr:SGNH/GDSL hydrolase family protein [Saccharothrix longispora]MDU0288817.1 SGNH/GDSL hydrolase family protein [Saccharothrix longispora]
MNTRLHRVLSTAAGVVALALPASVLPVPGLPTPPAAAAERAAAPEAAALAYVALGDSMPSGPLIPSPTGPLACGRSTHNYPHELAARLGAALTDVTCSGAAGRHLTEPQELSLLDIPAGTAPPQFDALRPDTGLVTLTIGGNDVGLVGIAQDCVRLDPAATPCAGEHEARLAQRLAGFGPKLAAALDGIRARSPRARVVVTGYGLYIKAGGCWPVQPVLPADADFLQGGVDRLNAVIAERSAAHGAEYVDLRTPSAGHDACQAPWDKWVEGYVPTDLAAPLHPNRRGEANYARIIADHVTGV